MHLPITIFQGESKSTISDFNRQFPIRLGYILDVKNKILNHIKNNSLIDLDYISSNDVEINILPYDKNNIVYSIFDNKSIVNNASFNFNFAVKINGNSAPKLSFIPDFVLRRGKEFIYYPNATDQDDDTLFYYTSSPNSLLIKINSTSGKFSFTPTAKGLYKINICVRDNYLANDCKDIKFIVENV